MYRNLYYTLGLIVALMGVLTSCTNEDPFNNHYSFEDSKSEYYWFDSNGIPYLYYGSASSSNPYETEVLDNGTQQRIQNLVVGHGWKPVETFIIEETGQVTPLDSPRLEELPIGDYAYYIGNDRLLTQYSIPELPTDDPAHQYYIDERLGMDLRHGDLFKDNIFGLTTYTFRLRILDIVEYDNQVTMRAIEPLCIVYYDDDIEGQFVFGVTTFTRMSDAETEQAFGELLQ